MKLRNLILVIVGLGILMTAAYALGAVMILKGLAQLIAG